MDAKANQGQVKIIMGNLAKSIQDKLSDSHLIISRILIPLGMYCFYCLVLYFVLPYGVNKVFITRSIKYILPITFILYVAYAAYLLIRKIKPVLFVPAEEKFSAAHLLLPLLPLTPVAQYVINNTDILSWLDIVTILGLFYLAACVPLIIIPRIFIKTGGYQSLTFLGLAFSYLFTNMAILSAYFEWYEEGSFLIPLLVMAGVWLISWLLYKSSDRSYFFLMIIVVFISNSVFQFVNRDSELNPSSLDRSDNQLISLVGDREPIDKPSIYLLIYDAYVINQTMLGYGIDNHQQEEFLEEQGFKIYPKTYSYWGSTLQTMGRVLNSSLSLYGNRRRATSGDGVVQNLLQGYGYKTYGIFSWDYFSRGRVPSYDFSFPDSSSAVRLLIKAILLGELRFDMDVSYITYEDYLDLKRDIFAEASGEPRFFYTHSHRPGHSQNSGACRPNETELFINRLESANIEMREDIELILEKDPGAILIVAGDHGPCLTKTCTQYLYPVDFEINEITRHDIQDRLGTFLAIRWPTSDFEEYDEIEIIQDVRDNHLGFRPHALSPLSPMN